MSTLRVYEVTKVILLVMSKKEDKAFQLFNNERFIQKKIVL